MNRSYINTHLVVDRYLQGELSEDEAAEFEERLVWDGGLVDEVDLAMKLREGIRAEQHRIELDVSGNRGALDSLVGWFQVPAFAAAASFMLAVGVSWTVLNNDRPNGEVLPPDQGLPTEIVPLFATRSADPSTVVISADSWSVILVDAPVGYEKFRVSVHPQDEQSPPVWSGEDLIPTYPDSLAVGMPGSVLVAGEYVLSLDGIVAGGDNFEHIQTIPFVVARP